MPLFFYPEICEFLREKDQKELEKELKEEVELFDPNRKKGENDSYLCELIRNDSIIDFIVYVNRTNLSLSKTKIKDSFYETNSFLIKNQPTLIEYAAFFGSIQIIQYLRSNHVEFEPEIWLYAIHGKNGEIIHLLEDNHVEPPNGDFEECLIESIKCHQNDISNYIRVNLIANNCIEKNRILKNIFKSYNFEMIPEEIKGNSMLFYLCRYNYSKLVNLYIEPIKHRINQMKLSDKDNQLQNAANEDNHDFIYALLAQMGNSVFYGCTSLKKIRVPSSITKIGESIFYKCSSLKKITIPSSVTQIGDSAFNGCSSLTYVLIPNSVTKIGKCVFQGCVSLKEISIPISVAEIEESSFRRCISLEHVTIPSSVTSINQYAFYELKKLFFMDAHHLLKLKSLLL